MERLKNKSDDPFWAYGQKGFDWNYEERQAKIGEFVYGEAEDSHKADIDLLKCDQLTDLIKYESVEENLTFNISNNESKKQASKLMKTFNPLDTQKEIIPDTVFSGPEQVVKNIIFGFDYSLSQFKGKNEKIHLLNSAVKSHDGNAMLEVILFLRNTLKKSVFQREIVAHPDAVNVYLTYLEEDHETDELANMLLLLNRPEDAAVLKYEAAITVQHPERKLKWIENSLSTHFQPEATDMFLLRSVEEHKQLLSEQIQLQKCHLTQYPNQHENMQIFEKLCGKQTVIDTSVLCTLVFCCLFWLNSNQLNSASPDKIKSNYNLSKKQYTWMGLRALAASQRWSEVDHLFTSKNWLGGVKVSSCIPYSRILEVLYKEKAPIEVMNKYVSCVENDQEKLLLAKRYRCHSVALEVFKNSKDRLGLLEYKSSLVPHSVDYCTATDLLNNQMIRWKN